MPNSTASKITPPLEPLVVELREVGEDQAADFGSKAVRLARSVRAGIYVPPAVCVSSAAFVNHVASCGPDVVRLVENQKWVELRDAIKNFPLDPTLTQVVADLMATRLPRDCTVAVRSSGSAEDLDATSSAGVYHSELSVSGPDQLATAIRKSWAAFWSA